MSHGKEDSIRSAFLQRQRLGPHAPACDGRYQVTIDLLRAIDRKGVLVCTHDAAEFSAENALFKIDFFTPAATGAKPTKESGWSAVLGSL